MYRRILTALALLLLATPAEAATRFATGFEWGTQWPQLTSGPTETLFDSASTTEPTIIAATGDMICDYESANYGETCTQNTDCGSADNAYASCMTLTDNDFEMRLQPGTGAINYVTIGSTYLSTGTDPLYVHFTVELASSQTLDPDETYDLVEIYASTGERFAKLRITALTTDTYQLEYYPADPITTADPIHNECSGGTNPGSRCTSCASDDDCSGTCTTGTCDVSGLTCSTDADCAVCYNAGPEKGACASECTSNSPGEQWCLPAQVAIVGPLTTGWRYEVALGYESGAEDPYATYSMWQGGYERGSTTKSLGYCSTTTTQTCTTDGNCPGAETCQWNIGAADTIRIGQTTNATATWDIRIDDIVVDDSSIERIANIRVTDEIPDANTNVDGFSTTISGGCATTCVNATAEYGCIDDINCTPGAQTGSYVSSPSGTSLTEDYYGLSNVDSQGGDTGTVLGIATYAVAHDNNVAGSPSGNDELCSTILVTTGGAETNDGGATETKIERQTEIGDETGYIPACYGLVDDADYATATLFNSAAIKVGADRTACDHGACASGGTDFVDVVTEVYLQQTAGVVPGIAADVNEDGVRTLCVAGDSTVDQSAFRAALLQDLNDFDTQIHCERGGATLGDIESEIQEILDGTEGGVMRCTVMKGDLQPCDYLLVVGGINTLTSVAYGLVPGHYCTAGADLGEPCDTSADCDGTEPCEYYANGYCRGGANHGLPCDCPAPRPLQADNVYCANAKDGGVDWLQPDPTDDCKRCANNADCNSNISCATNTDCNVEDPLGLYTDALCCSDAGDCATPGGDPHCLVPCSGGICGRGLGADPFRDGGLVRPPQWRLAGCPDTADCPDGLCWSSNTLAEAERSFAAIVAEAHSRTGTGSACSTDCKVELVVGVQPRASSDQRRCASGTYENQRCATDTDCGGDVCSASAGWNFEAHAIRHDALEQHMRQWAIDSGTMFIDLDRYYQVHCEDGGDGCKSDQVHWNSLGYAAAGQAIENCFENIYSTADGICTNNLCTQGAVGDVCGRCSEDANIKCETNSDCAGTCDATDRDCALYQCDLLNPDWKSAMTAFFGFDNVCIGGTNPWDDCADDNDCSGGTCNTTSATAAELWDRSGRGNLLSLPDGTPTPTAPSGVLLGTGHAVFSGTNSYACTNTTCPLLRATAGQSKSWGGWFYITSTQAADQWLINRIAGTTPNNGYRASRATSSTSPTAKCELRLNGSTVFSDLAAAGTFTSSAWHHIACVYTYSASGSETLETFIDGASNGATTGSGNFGANQTNFQINTATTTADWAGAADEVFVIDKALDAGRVNRIISGSIPGDFVDCDGFTAANYTECTQNTDCGSDGEICDTADSATDDTYCNAADDGAAGAGCCMGYNSTRAGGLAMTACNAIP